MNFLAERKRPGGKSIFPGYAVQSIANFVDNVNYLKGGGKLKDLEGLYPSAKEGLEITTIMAAAHKSLAEKRIVEISEVSRSL